MPNNTEINELIIQTVENTCDDLSVQELIKEALQYELDIWNRHILPSAIKDEYERMVEKTIKRGQI
ncbi:MAG: hypothetical protein ABIH92_00360 [Nanoarchaeota archaeon]